MNTHRVSLFLYEGGRKDQDYLLTLETKLTFQPTKGLPWSFDGESPQARVSEIEWITENGEMRSGDLPDGCLDGFFIVRIKTKAKLKGTTKKRLAELGWER